jgi:hypothetical protein
MVVGYTRSAQAGDVETALSEAQKERRLPLP